MTEETGLEIWIGEVHNCGIPALSAPARPGVQMAKVRAISLYLSLELELATGGILSS